MIPPIPGHCCDASGNPGGFIPSSVSGGEFSLSCILIGREPRTVPRWVMSILGSLAGGVLVGLACRGWVSLPTSFLAEFRADFGSVSSHLPSSSSSLFSKTVAVGHLFLKDRIFKVKREVSELLFILR